MNKDYLKDQFHSMAIAAVLSIPVALAVHFLDKNTTIFVGGNIAESECETNIECFKLNDLDLSATP